MGEPGIEQIRCFRLHSHHLDAAYEKEEILKAAGTCGMINTPPGAWETALYNRVRDCVLSDMGSLLYREKLLLQAWSLRGAPVIFPSADSHIFLSALIPEKDEPWIYTRGITLALDFLHMTFEEVFQMIKQVIPRLDDHVIVSKTVLDQTLAEWMLPLVPSGKRELWSQPSMYGNPDRQTVGGAVVSFLLRPCAFSGLVVFGGRDGVSPSFTSYKNWTGRPMTTGKDAAVILVRRYLHCYGPATADMFISWLGCSPKQGRRIWNLAAGETEPVMLSGRKAFILSSDRNRLFTPAAFQRELLLLGGHDPFLDQRDRMVLQPDKALHKEIWKMSANPGTVVYRGEIIGVWSCTGRNGAATVKIRLWTAPSEKNKLRSLAEQYAVFRGLKLQSVEIEG